MNISDLPELIQVHIKNMVSSKNLIGCSESSVYKFSDDDRDLYLKFGIRSEEIFREHLMMKWLQDRVNVPHILEFCRDENYDYLLMSKVAGIMACSKQFLDTPDILVKSLAEGIIQLQQVDIINCPITCNLQFKLDVAYERIKSNQVDMEDWEETTLFESPQELFKYLVDNKTDEDLVLTHGDYCLPNIFIDDEGILGYIDLGRSGIAYKWQDIALCVRSLERNLASKEYTDLFFYHLGIKPDYDKINYYILLDELF